MSGLADAGYAGPVTTGTPVVTNPPGLPAIAYRVADFTGFRRALLQPLSGEQSIANWQPAPGDLGLQVLEWWAYLGDVLTFYNERFANESYLGTAGQPGSVADLVALLGYRPAPGLAASGTVAVIRKPARPAEPLVIPAGMPLASQASAGLPSQTFETGPAITFKGPSSLPVGLPADTSLAPNPDGSYSLLLAGHVSGVSAGDELLLVPRAFNGTADDWGLITVSSTASITDPASGATNTLVQFPAPTWGPPDAYATRFPAPGWGVPGVYGERFEYLFWGYRWFRPAAGPGPNAQVTDYRLLRPAASASLWNQGGSPTPITGGTPFAVDLSAVAAAIAPGDLVLIEQPGVGGALGVVAQTNVALGAIPPASSSEASGTLLVAPIRAEMAAVAPGSSGNASSTTVLIPHTQLSLTLTQLNASTLSNWQWYQVTTSLIVRYGFKDVGTIIGVPGTTVADLPVTVQMATVTAPALNAQALLQDATGSGVAVTIGTVTVDGDTSQVQLTAGLDPVTIEPPLVAPLQLLLDLVSVSRGSTVKDEVVGSGNAALINQSFTLAKSPLTYLRGPSGPISTLAVYVDGVMWQEVPSFYAQSPTAQVFTVSRSPDQSVTTVQFGDGINGARVSSGSGNITATYRYGSGAATPPAGRLTTIVTPQPNLGSVVNPVAVSGGLDPQSPDDVRTNAPASVASLTRAISATDYEAMAASGAGVQRATAYAVFDPIQQRPLVRIYVDGGSDPVRAAQTALAGTEDPNRPVNVLPVTELAIGLSCTLQLAVGADTTAVVAAATAAVSALFAPAEMGIGQAVYRSAVAAALMVPGVLAVLDLLVAGGQAEVVPATEGAVYTLGVGQPQIGPA